jgi:hypothetical protein
MLGQEIKKQNRIGYTKQEPRKEIKYQTPISEKLLS